MRGRPVTKNTRLPKSPLEDEQWPFTPEEELALFVEMEHQQLEAEPSHTLPAFNALAFIMAATWKREETGAPEAEVVLPKWVAETLAQGFFKYRDAAHASQKVSLDEAFCLEGRGQGRQPPIVREKVNVRDIRIAISIAKRKLDNVKIEAALQEMADATGLSLGQIRRIWEKHRKKALSALNNLRTRKTL